VIFRISCWFSAGAEAVITWLRRCRGPGVAVRGMPASTAAGRRARSRLWSVRNASPILMLISAPTS